MAEGDMRKALGLSESKGMRIWLLVTTLRECFQEYTSEGHS